MLQNIAELKEISAKYKKIENDVLLDGENSITVVVPEFILDSVEAIKTLSPNSLNDSKNIELIQRHLELAFNQGKQKLSILPPEYNVMVKTIVAAILTRQANSEELFLMLVRNSLYIMYKLGCQDRGDYLSYQDLSDCVESNV